MAAASSKKSVPTFEEMRERWKECRREFEDRTGLALGEPEFPSLAWNERPRWLTARVWLCGSDCCFPYAFFPRATYPQESVPWPGQSEVLTTVFASVNAAEDAEELVAAKRKEMRRGSPTEIFKAQRRLRDVASTIAISDWNDDMTDEEWSAVNLLAELRPRRPRLGGPRNPGAAPLARLVGRFRTIQRTTGKAVPLTEGDLAYLLSVVFPWWLEDDIETVKGRVKTAIKAVQRRTAREAASKSGKI